MPRCVTCGLWIGVFVLAAFPAAVRAADLVEPTGEAALAWKLDAISGSTLGPAMPDPVWRQCMALLEAATRLDPGELRFPRLRMLALSHIGDTAGAIAALREYRKLAPADRIAQLELIDLYASGIETVDGRVDYFSDLLEKQDIPVEVRAAVAVQTAGLLAQKSPELAAQMATRAVELYPLAQATRLYYRYVGRREKELPKQVAALLAVIKADPNQPAYLEELATLLASHGLADASLQWYNLTIYTMLRSGAPLPPGFHNLVIDYVSEAFVAGRLALADAKVGQLLEQQSLNADAWFLKLTADRAISPQLFAQQIDQARTAFIRRWNALHDQVLTGNAAQADGTGQKAPTNASDVKVEPLDPGPVVAKLTSQGNSRNKDATISVVSDLAWFYLYFDNKPELAAKWIDALRPLLAADSVSMQRLDGWHALVAGNTQKAREILAKVADKDALSEFGLIRADEADKKPVDPAQVTRLLNANRIGLVAAMLWTALKTDANRPTTQPVASEVLKELARFPAQFLAVLDPNPRSVETVYNVRLEPVQASLSFGAPALFRVTISNTGDNDITIGEDELLHRDLWFDARILGFERQVLNGVAFDQIENDLVLRAHDSMTQIVRLDGGELRQALAQSPGAPTTVNCGAVTNPVPVRDPESKQEQIIPGPGGATSNFYSTFTYVGVSLLLPSGKKQIEDALVSTSPVEKMHTIDLLVAYYHLAQHPSADQAVRLAAGDLPARIGRLRHDSSSVVAAWADYVSAGIAKDAEREKIVSEMASSSDWTTRLLSLFAGNALPVEKRKEVATALANDPDPTVKAAAAATVDLLDQKPSSSVTQPARDAAGK